MATRRRFTTEGTEDTEVHSFISCSVLSVYSVVILLFTASVQAQSGFEKLLFRLTDFTGNQNYRSNPQGGPLFDNNLYDQRIMFNRLGQGFTFDQFRFFGPDTFDNPNTFDLGPLKLQLGRDPTIESSVQPVGVHNSIGFTTTLLPEVTFSSKTGQRNFDIFSGATNFASAPVHYDLSFFSGVQDYKWSGNMLVDSNGRVNALGFYDFNLRITNVGNATADGVVMKDEKVTDFDTGPVHLSGNLLFEGIGSLFQGLGQGGLASPFHILSDAPPKDKKTDELLARIKAGEKLSDADMSYLVQQMIVSAFLSDPLGFLTNGMPETVPGFEDLAMKTSPAGTPPGPDPNLAAVSNAAIAGASNQTLPVPPDTSTVPEPGTLILLAGATAWVAAMQPFRRRKR